MNDENIITPLIASELFSVSISKIYLLIKQGKLTASILNGKYSIERDELFFELFSKSEELQEKENTQPYFPKELEDYKKWHKLLDYYSWLLKVCYTTPSDIKKKKFNIRVIFENYLRINNVVISKIKVDFSSKGYNEVKITKDLKRGWYNELAFIFPLKQDTLGISFREVTTNLDISSSRFTFPSWKIIESYYSVYFHLRSVVQFKSHNLKLDEHTNNLNSFKNNALASLKKTVWKFPLDIEYKSDHKFYLSKTMLSNLTHLKYKYCLHPYVENQTPYQITKSLYEYLKISGKRQKRNKHFTIFDLLREFRNWSNYIDVDNLFSLTGKGYKGYLDQNLSLILFIIAGISELIYIAVLGQDKYLSELKNLYDLYSKNDNNVKENFVYTSIYQRMRIFRINGYINKEIEVEKVVNLNEIT